jgi:hypothetical protein
MDARRGADISFGAMKARALLIAIPAAIVVAAAIAIPAISAPSAPKPSEPIGTQCPVFPSPGTDVAADAPSLDDQRAWHQDISQAPVASNSAQIMNAIPGGSLHPDFGSPSRYGIPYVVVDNSTKLVKVKWTAYGDEATHGKYRIPLNAPIEGGKNADGDRHVIAFDVENCKLYELFNAAPDKKHRRWKADGGVIWDLNSAGLRQDGITSADAAGLPIFPGLVRYEEVAAGAVNHAIRLTFAETRDAWIHPASHCAGSTSDPAVVSMGQRLRLKSSYDISGITGQAQPIAEAMKKYGFIVADNGSDWYFSGSSDPRFDDDNLNQLKEIPGSAFEVVATQADVQPC